MTDHIIIDRPLNCWAQLATVHTLAAHTAAIVHLTAGCYGEPKRKRPGLGSGCMPLTESGSDRCRHDLDELRRDGALDLGPDIECWKPSGTPTDALCDTCHGQRGKATAYPDEYPTFSDVPSRLPAQVPLW